MITVDLGPEAPFFRALSPQWSYAPESGAGAAECGGRFNRPGVEARYLSQSANTALLEYQAESTLLLPATVATYLVTAKNVVNFSSGYDPKAWQDIWAEAGCNWKGLAYLDGIEPPSWVIGDLVREGGYPGLLYRSTRDPSGVCLVLFPEMAATSGFKATVHDPDGRLPRDRASWKAPVFKPE